MTAARPAAWPITALACCLPAFTPHAFAGGPLTTDEADALAPRACEWETVVARLRHQQPHVRPAWQSELGCGVGGNLQLTTGIASSADANDSDTGSTRSRLAGFGAKLQLLGGADKDALRLAATWGLNMLRVSGSAFTVNDNSLTLVASQGFADVWNGHVNIGWQRDRQAAQSSTTWNLALERDLGHGVDGTAEVFGDDRDTAWLSAGLRWSPSAHISLHGAFSVRRGSASARLATLGVKLSF